MLGREGDDDNVFVVQIVYECEVLVLSNSFEGLWCSSIALGPVGSMEVTKTAPSSKPFQPHLQVDSQASWRKCLEGSHHASSGALTHHSPQALQFIEQIVTEYLEGASGCAGPTEAGTGPCALLSLEAVPGSSGRKTHGRKSSACCSSHPITRTPSSNSACFSDDFLAGP